MVEANARAGRTVTRRLGVRASETGVTDVIGANFGTVALPETTSANTVCYASTAHTGSTYVEDTHTEDTHTEDTHTRDTHTRDTHTRDTHARDTHTADTHTVTAGTELDDHTPLSLTLRRWEVPALEVQERDEERIAGPVPLASRRRRPLQVARTPRRSRAVRGLQALQAYWDAAAAPEKDSRGSSNGLGEEREGGEERGEVKVGDGTGQESRSGAGGKKKKSIRRRERREREERAANTVAVRPSSLSLRKESRSRKSKRAKRTHESGEVSSEVSSEVSCEVSGVVRNERRQRRTVTRASVRRGVRDSGDRSSREPTVWQTILKGCRKISAAERERVEQARAEAAAKKSERLALVDQLGGDADNALVDLFASGDAVGDTDVNDAFGNPGGSELGGVGGEEKDDFNTFLESDAFGFGDEAGLEVEVEDHEEGEEGRPKRKKLKPFAGAWKVVKPAKWTEEDINTFYANMAMFGQDPMILRALMPHFTEAELQRRMAFEQRVHPERVYAAITRESKAINEEGLEHFQKIHGVIDTRKHMQYGEADYVDPIAAARRAKLVASHTKRDMEMNAFDDLMGVKHPTKLERDDGDEFDDGATGDLANDTYTIEDLSSIFR